MLGDRLMFRLAYRNFGGYASLVLNHTVQADARDRHPLVRGADPDERHAVDLPAGHVRARRLGRRTRSGAGWARSRRTRSGDIALGYSASGPNDYPSIRYTGRAAGDPLGQMTQAEQVAFTGTGPQTEAEGRWGDYSDMTVDPADDCTFWYTQEYLADRHGRGSGPGAPRVVSFKFPGCKR